MRKVQAVVKDQCGFDSTIGQEQITSDLSQGIPVLCLGMTPVIGGSGRYAGQVDGAEA